MPNIYQFSFRFQSNIFEFKVQIRLKTKYFYACLSIKSIEYKQINNADIHIIIPTEINL